MRSSGTRLPSLQPIHRGQSVGYRLQLVAGPQLAIVQETDIPARPAAMKAAFDNGFAFDDD
ncbi:hypothetical protein ACWGS9_23570 [Bradyrhizobium sp. Arg314]